MADRIRVAVLFGGRSSEHSISCATAGGVLGALDRERFEVIPVGITRDGAWTLLPDDAAGLTLGAELPVVADNGSRVRLPVSAATREWTVVEADGSERSLGAIDAAFPILHGPFGEDGTVQGALELVGVPYVGNGVLASAVGMHKHFTKSVLTTAGLVVAPWVTLTRSRVAAGLNGWRERVEALGLPVFVKPSRSGSSVGVSKVSSWDALDAALADAFSHDHHVIVEAGLAGREIEFAVLEGRDGAPPRVSLPGEIVVTGREFYDFEAKYLDAPGVQLLCPAPLEPAQLAEGQRLAAAAFDAIGGQGLARVDFFLTAEGWVVNEVNTMPGFTPISMFPRCWTESGLSYPELVAELIELGIAADR